MIDISGKDTGTVSRIFGPVVGAAGLSSVRLHDVVRVGELKLIGEVIGLTHDLATVQVYEDTSQLRVGEPVENTGHPMVVWLGPGLLGQIYDGLQRPLVEIAASSGNFVPRGVKIDPLLRNRKWDFVPCVEIGEEVGPGDVLGVVPETPAIEHRVMTPPGVMGRLLSIHAGQFTLDDVIAVIETEADGESQHHEVRLAQPWPVRRPRPVLKRLIPDEPLVTGIRVIDTLFPVGRGGAAIIAGGFGTGKTVVEQTLARQADVDVVIYVGCGERGNEMAEVLEEFPALTDPHLGLPLMNRTVLIANTSNMPVAAREASIYTGITIAEYYRDMGYHVLMLADSTSRWGEALREISGRLEEIPGEEGYPAYLAARLSAFYERSGKVNCLGRQDTKNDGRGIERVGSVTIVGAISPPGGDFSDPIAQASLRVTGAFWALDYALSRARHFPAINWSMSYTLYDLAKWYEANVARGWTELVRAAKTLLQQADALEDIVKLVGPEALSDSERLLLSTATMVRHGFLHQSTYDQIDHYCSSKKAFCILQTIMELHALGQAGVERGVTLAQLMELPQMSQVSRLKQMQPEEAAVASQQLIDSLRTDIDQLGDR